MVDLPDATQSYFKRLSGYDTLRVVLADMAILVEGPSDDLIVQRAFRDRYGCLPLEREVDVISVKGLSFKRFLDIAINTGTIVRVVTDNDGNPDAVIEKYSSYLECANISVCFSTDPSLKTLEPQIVAVNSLESLNSALGKEYKTKDEVQNYMMKNKTEAALLIFESETELIMPDYIVEAIYE
jgi:predicted ATP-dependent endonuclease of OLD family